MRMLDNMQVFYIVQYIMMTFATTKSKFYPNIGPRTCEDICLRTVGCFGYKYSSNFLSCQLPETYRVDDVDPNYVNIPLRKDKDDDVFMMKPPCPLQSRKLHSKISFLKCRVESHVTDEDSTQRSPKLLLISQSGKVFQLKDFKRKPLLPYKVNPDMPRRFRSIQYLPASRMLLVLTVDNDLIFMPNTGKGSKRLMKSKIIVTSITDDTIFYVHGQNRLAKMNQYGKINTFITVLKFTPKAMTVDRKLRLILLSTSFAIHKYAYSGKVKSIFDFKVHKMHFDLIVNVLFAHSETDGHIYRFDKKGRFASRPIFKSRRSVNNICAHNDILYIIYKQGVMEVHRIYQPSYSPFTHVPWYACCIIP